METQTDIYTREERFRSAVYGTAALSYVSAELALDVLDSIADEHPTWIKGMPKHYYYDIVGKQGRMGHADRVYASLTAVVPYEDCQAWMRNFGNAVMRGMERPLFLLHHTVANYLGNFPKVEDRNAMADLVIAQSMAAETVRYAEREKERLQGCNVTMKGFGSRVPVSLLIESLCCSQLKFALTQLCDYWLGSKLPDSAAILSCDECLKARDIVMRTLESSTLWSNAVADAEEKHRQANGDKTQNVSNSL